MARLPSKGSVTSIDHGKHRDRVLAARNRLIEQHVVMVPPIAKRIHQALPPSFDIEDLICTGNLALLRAATVYRPKKHGGCPFSAFARHRIRGAIIDSIRRRHYIENTRPSIDGMVPEGRPLNSYVREGVTTPVSRPIPVAKHQPDLDADLDRTRLLKRLELAVTQLTEDQRELLDVYYAEETDRLKRAHFRRRKQVVEMHAAILEILRSELAS